MDLSVNEIEIPTPIPISSSNYVDGCCDSHGQSQNPLPPFRLLHHHHHPSNGPPPPSLPLQSPAPLTFSSPLLGQRTVSVNYRECLKNHAASIGGNATDGCGEFMPSGEEGTIEALKCSACACHRNFHRKEFDGDQCFNHRAIGKKFTGQKSSYGLFNTGEGIDSLILSNNPSDHHHNQMMMPFGSVQTSDSEERPPPPPSPTAKKKRFRTRFTAEQKEKMLCFAEKAGWRLQKQEESVVQQLCSEIGVKRRVLKVWMHNNKHNLAKKLTSNLQLQ